MRTKVGLILFALPIVPALAATCNGPYTSQPSVYCPYTKWTELWFVNNEANFKTALAKWIDGTKQILISATQGIKLYDGTYNLYITYNYIKLSSSSDYWSLSSTNAAFYVPMYVYNSLTANSLNVNGNAQINGDVTANNLAVNNTVTTKDLSVSNSATLNSVTVNGNAVFNEKTTFNKEITVKATSDGNGYIYVTEYTDGTNTYPAIKLCYGSSCAYIYYDGNNVTIVNQ
ncbi:NEQ492 [Nanoarchaeum equitans Kin4-M]|uniref:NEQ492 n=1 Tax=Nanoarchaeum equitans (strain Kin4-M) TaxID=228908 RepID=Q74M59_NANEQ|nr:NEQ492 [Nanoarchaeum equitans Kin4-M]